METYFIKTLERLCMEPGVSEYEKESGIADAIITMVQELGASATIDHQGNVISVVGGGEKTILIEAHMDEIGFVVEKVNGVATLSARGIVKEEKIADSNAYVLGKNINGVIQSDDAGVFVFALTNENEKAQIQSGDIVALRRSFIQKGNTIKAGALDNRLGCATLLTILREVKEKKYLDHKIVFIFSTREEVDTSSFDEIIKMYGGDFAIVVDAAYAKPVDFDANALGVAIPTIGEGCAIQTKGKGFVIKSQVVEWMEQIARDNDIRTQRETAPEGLGKTNFVQMVAEGVREGVVINIPAKNQHNEVGEANAVDAEEAIRLIKAILEEKVSQTG